MVGPGERNLLGPDDELIRVVVERGNDLFFTQYFWRGCEPLETDLAQFGKFVKVHQLSSSGMSQNGINLTTGIPGPTISTWVRLVHVPKLGCYLREFLEVGKPREGHTWLSISTSHGHGIPYGPFIQVPTQIRSWQDVEGVIQQLTPIGDTKSGCSRQYLFGFFLGTLIGDAAKSKRGRFHRHLALVLSKKYPTNERIGDFTCLCAQELGLRMHRLQDQEKRPNKPHGFYVWVSQASPLLDWIFNVCLGLKDGQSTTYDPISAEWVLTAPEDFRKGLVQGLAESDGSVSVPGQEVEFWIGPNFELMKNLLATFGLRSFQSREATSLSKSEAVKAFAIPIFSPLLKTVRYERHKRMATGQKLPQGGARLSPEVRAEVRRLRMLGMSVPSIIDSVLERYGLLISFEAAQRWANKPESGVKGAD